MVPLFAYKLGVEGRADYSQRLKKAYHRKPSDSTHPRAMTGPSDRAERPSRGACNNCGSQGTAFLPFR
jgi:hypothetical protein